MFFHLFNFKVLCYYDYGGENMSLGKNIKYYRTKKGLTQKNLAKLTGLAEITIRQYESDKYEPKRENLYKIRKILDVSLEQLIGSMPDMSDMKNYDQYDDGTYVPKNMIWDDNTLRLLKVIDKANQDTDYANNIEKQNEEIFNSFGAFPKSYSEFLLETDTKAKEEFFSLINKMGYEVFESEDNLYELTGKYGPIHATKEELKILETNIMNFISYTVDKFYDEKRDLKFNNKHDN